MQDEFTEAEARALVGRKVRTRVDFSGVPAGTTARVNGAAPGRAGWTVALTWDMEDRPRPLTDWFSKGEYEKFIEELADMDARPQPGVIYLRPRGDADAGAQWSDPSPVAVNLETVTAEGWTGWPVTWATMDRPPLVYPAFAWEQVREL